MTRAARTDAHRPSVLIPAHYAYRIYYSTAHEAEGWPQPPINVDEVIEIHHAARDAGKQVFGAIGTCGVCGAHYKHGALFVHEPTGDLVHMGEDCAAKYEIMVDWSEAELARDRVHRATAKAIQAEANKNAREAVLAANPGLDVALAMGEAEASAAGIGERDYRMLGAHQILSDLARKFHRFCELSEKQIELAFRLHAQITTPPAERPVEIKMPAPADGTRQTFTGEIVGANLYHSEQWGSSWKVTIKVTRENDGAIWLAWGSVASSLIEQIGQMDSVSRARMVRDEGDAWEKAIKRELRGLVVEVTATLAPSTDRRDEDGRVTKEADPSFCFLKRPTMRVVGMVDRPTKPAPPKKTRKSSPASGVLGTET